LDGIVTVHELAGRLGVSPTTVRRMLAAGTIPHERRGRRYLVLRGDYDRWERERLRAGGQAPAPPALAEVLPRGPQRLVIEVGGLEFIWTLEVRPSRQRRVG